MTILLIGEPRSVFFLENDITPSSINEAERRSSLLKYGVYVIKILFDKKDKREHEKNLFVTNNHVIYATKN